MVNLMGEKKYGLHFLHLLHSYILYNTDTLSLIVFRILVQLLLLPTYEYYPERAASTDPQWLQGVAAPASHSGGCSTFFFSGELCCIFQQ